MTYLDYCKERCEWCAKGLPSFGTGGDMCYHIIGGVYDAEGISGGRSVCCTAPSPEALIAELSGQIEGLKAEVRDERKNAAWEAERAQKAIDERDAAIQRAETAESLRNSACVVLEDQLNTNAALKQAIAAQADEIRRLKEALQSAGAAIGRIFSATRTSGLDYGYPAVADMAQKEAAAIVAVLAVKP